MLLDARIDSANLRLVPELARGAEAAGIDGLWFNEIAHDPFLGATLAAEHTARVAVGTAIALAFVRSPTTLAHAAWDLARLSGGRFILGLGPQVRAHIERRFAMPWEPPIARLRDVIGAVRAIWDSWRTGAKLRYQGRFYTLTLMTPFFTPPSFEGPIPVFLAAVNRGMCRLAGEVADGLHVHPFHSVGYLKEVILPAVDRGLARAGRQRKTFTLAGSVLVAVRGGADDRHQVDDVRRTIAFYASTPSYRPVLAHHGWEGVGEQLSRLAAAQRWDEMPGLVSEEMIDAFAVQGTPVDIGRILRGRYAGTFDRIAPYRFFALKDPVWDGLRGLRA